MPLTVLIVSCSQPPQRTTIKGIEFTNLEVGRRDSDRKVPVALQITNTGSSDVPGMQVAFEAEDSEGTMGPFWLPRLGDEGDWALRAGESRSVRTEIIGFGNRDMSSARIVDVKILGEDVKQVADRPVAIRREVFSKLIECERAGSNEALKKYPEVAGQSSEEFMKVFKERRELENTLVERCKAAVIEKFALSSDEEKLISVEGASMSWPPMGNN